VRSQHDPPFGRAIRGKNADDVWATGKHRLQLHPRPGMPQKLANKLRARLFPWLIHPGIPVGVNAGNLNEGLKKFDDVAGLFHAYLT
jgi:hypothetical protein